MLVEVRECVRMRVCKRKQDSGAINCNCIFISHIKNVVEQMSRRYLSDYMAKVTVSDFSRDFFEKALRYKSALS
jgi:ABC-type oligopeptide transport system ATPase subunit